MGMQHFGNLSQPETQHMETPKTEPKLERPDIEELPTDIQDRPGFEDSERFEGVEPPMDGLDADMESVDDQTFRDSDRENPEGPQWDEGLMDSNELDPREIPEDSDLRDHLEAPENGDMLDHPEAPEKSDMLDTQEAFENGDVRDTEASERTSIEGDNTEAKTDSPERGEDGTRDLTEDEKQNIKDELGWSDDRIKRCTVDEDGVIHLKTDRCDLEGKLSENGVPYERKTIEINGIKIEGVFPVFESAFNTELAPDKYESRAYAKECNAKLKEAVENDPELRDKFTPEQIKDIEEGRTPAGYVWHHNEEPGKMQLVKREDHDRTMGGAAHTGGCSLWGADSVDRSKKGESF